MLAVIRRSLQAYGAPTDAIVRPVGKGEPGRNARLFLIWVAADQAAAVEAHPRTQELVPGEWPYVEPHPFNGAG